MIWVWWAEFLGLVLLAPVAVSCALGEGSKRAAWWLGVAWVVIWVGVGAGLVMAVKFDSVDGLRLGGGYWGWAICRAWCQGWSFVPVGVALVGMWMGGVAVKRGVKAGWLGLGVAVLASMMPVTLCELEARAQVAMQELRVMGVMAREGRVRIGPGESDERVMERMQEAWRAGQQGPWSKEKEWELGCYYERVMPVRESIWRGVNGREVSRSEKALHFKCMRLVEVTSGFNVVERIFLLMPWGEWTDAKRMLSGPHMYPFVTRGIDRLTQGADVGSEATARVQEEKEGGNHG